MVLFRGPTGDAAKAIFRGMLGLSGITLPQQIFDRLGPLMGLMHSVVSMSTSESVTDLAMRIAWVLVLLAIAFALPNSLQLTARYEPAIGVKQQSSERGKLARFADWSPSFPWAVLMAVLAAAAIINVGGKSEFLYWQF